ncbi:MAG: ribonucleoside-diphosphate reductase subunit alpha, partial [Cocleimonas sp.]|nr:ribonucleoside-diphosphate reductase subunit alpha [Cocleimonas sp.]
MTTQNIENKSSEETRYKVIRRNGKVTPFNVNKIIIALTKAFLNVEGEEASGSARIHKTVARLSDKITECLFRRMPESGIVHIENIQDQVELALMRAGEQKVARSYVLYREQRAQIREQKASNTTKPKKKPMIRVKTASGALVPLDEKRLQKLIKDAVKGLSGVDEKRVLKEAMYNIFNGIAESDINTALVMSTRVMIERDPNYSTVAARLLLDGLRQEAMSFIHNRPSHATHSEMKSLYPELLKKYIDRAIDLELVDEELGRYDLKKLGAAIKPKRDQQFTYLGLQTLYDRYFIHTEDGIRFELPQIFFMRVAMGLAINEIHREERAIEFYNLLSSFNFMSSTPTLFNSGTLRPQLSSCYLTTVPDNLSGIYDAIKDNALLSKFAGGLGNDWTPVRGLGSHIKGTNGKSQGIVPFLKVSNDTAVAVNQCFAAETPLYTADGVKAIRDVKQGDLVLGISGTYREVTQSMLYNQQDPMVSIDITHAIKPTKVTAGHPFYGIRNVPVGQSNKDTYNELKKGQIKPEWIEASKLQQGDYLAQVIPKEILPVNGFTEDDARLYGILLNAGHFTKERMEWNVSALSQNDTHLHFVRDYLTARHIQHWEMSGNDHTIQLHWSSKQTILRDATTGCTITADAAILPFSDDELYNSEGQKYIARDYNHLPHTQTLALLQGLLEAKSELHPDHKEIHFSHHDYALIEGVRYQCLRLGIPTAGLDREE